MELCIKQRVFAWTDTYDVYDRNGEALYYVKNEFLSLGHQIHVYDSRTGEEVGAVYQRLLTFLPKFDIELGGKALGTISREFSFLQPRYRVDFRDWDVEGDFLQWDYSVYQGNRQVMTISRELLTWGDTYMLRCDDPRDALPGLLLVIAIDAANCGNN